MINIEHYIRQLIDLLKLQFGARLLYVGLQGSYLRGEATDSSDIDIMVVIDALSVADLSMYRAVIGKLDHADKSCGFICGKTDLANWNPLEICHLLHSTKDYYGNLHELVPVYTESDIRSFVKMSLNNLYHELCHRYIHGKPEKTRAALPGMYKSVFFILQNRYYLTHGQFPITKTELLQMACDRDRTVLERSSALKQGEEYDFEESFELLFTWCQETLESV